MEEGSCIKIMGGNTRGKTLDLGNHGENDLICGGAFLINCVLDIQGTAFTVTDANLLNCRIKVRDHISNVRFVETVFERCVFEGTYIGCRFGFRRGESSSPNAYFRMCDFSNAKLDLCDFFVGDVDSIIWPRWPNIVVLNPQLNKQDWLSIEFPDELRGMKEVVAGEALNSKTADNEPQAITVDLAKHETFDPDKILPLVQNKPYIVFEGKGV